jgi:hypothetical protein
MRQGRPWHNTTFTPSFQLDQAIIPAGGVISRHRLRLSYRMTKAPQVSNFQRGRITIEGDVGPRQLDKVSGQSTTTLPPAVVSARFSVGIDWLSNTSRSWKELSGKRRESGWDTPDHEEHFHAVCTPARLC